MVNIVLLSRGEVSGAQGADSTEGGHDGSTT